jgi:large subunit ribosomal protein L24
MSKNKLHIKKGDNVRILTGVDRGREGRVLVVYPEKKTAIVEGMRLVKKHMKPNQDNPDGGILEQEAPIHVSNLMLIDPSTKNPTRIGRRRAESGKGWIRFGKKSGQEIK